MKIFISILTFALFAVSCEKRAPWAEELAKKDKYAEAITKLSQAKTEEDRFCALNAAETEAYNAGKKDEAGRYAAEQAGLLPKYRKNWNYGNAVHDINSVLGRIALSEGRTEDAKKFLLKSADSDGSPQMNSFGPNMILAKELLEKGEREAVLQYFKKCSRFWKGSHGELGEWTKQVEAGQTPDFGANLLY
ncbi:MAG: hypothetical protein A2X28_05900 [Elusimicrobia bacterium GWA2_56_46]|nr:MAG: hypothetical protein A2X28_05900 [Elusimicrobia bacterium GWA2_56_46]OGR54356.1 MAG: hypothetical protein A2X39_06470 [Elusimicrobia bacterium GWC2_56_31]HBB65728.1 hypothetical protein [Elusimicrobiota bacterium]HBW22793.1 hypothetical protein [Elusimicrobiota bacterium]